MLYVVVLILCAAGVLQGDEFLIVKVDLIRDPQGCVYAHNVVRHRHGVANVTWDDSLAYDAESYALHLAKTKSFQHSPMNGYGENLYSMWGQKSPTYCNVAVHAWYSEITKYDYNNPTFDEQTGHFTELVWDGVVSIGVGSVYDPASKNAYVVARYVPSGNSENDAFKTHVPKPLPGTTIPSISDLTLVSDANPFISVINIDVDDTKSRPCEDVAQCAYYVSQNDCVNADYKEWMKDNCYKSCKYCVPGPPVDGGWSEWTSVEECTSSCTQLQQRFCLNPPPSNGGRNCKGDDTQTVACKDGLCVSDDCVDKNSQCQGFTEKGYCEDSSEYSAWMKENCKHSCGLCPSGMRNEL